MDTIDREQLEEEIRELSRQCQCYSYNGPCRFCRKAEKLNEKLDRLQIEDFVIQDIVQWLRAVDGPGFQMAASAIERGDWRKKESPAKAVDKP
jgi:hypothetical protein